MKLNELKTGDVIVFKNKDKVMLVGGTFVYPDNGSLECNSSNFDEYLNARPKLGSGFDISYVYRISDSKQSFTFNIDALERIYGRGFAVGQDVIITNPVFCYTSYSEWFSEQQLPSDVNPFKYDYGNLPDECATACVEAIGHHANDVNTIIYLISWRNRYYLINENGLKAA